MAQVPSTVLTVEYVDGSEGMESAVRALEERLARLEKVLLAMKESNTEMVSLFSQHTKELSQFVASLNRRVDRIYRSVNRDTAPPAAPATKFAAPEPTEHDIPAQFADDSAHQQAWRIARVIASDLDAYYPDLVREGIVYNNFEEVLEEPLQQARETYTQRVPEEVTQQCDYLELALKRLIAEKREQMQAEDEAAG